MARIIKRAILRTTRSDGFKCKTYVDITEDGRIGVKRITLLGWRSLETTTIAFKSGTFRAIAEVYFNSKEGYIHKFREGV